MIVLIVLIISTLLGYLAYLDYSHSCKHKYKILSEKENRFNDKTIDFIYVCRCIHCGEIKRHKI